MNKLIFIISIGLFNLSTQAQTVSTQFGQIQGSLNGSIYQFLGVPFAKAPVDTLRWKAPQNPTPWSGTLSTTSFAPVCPQKRFEQGDTTYTIEGNEDCLYLNIWSPQISSGNKAVMVFIHGGGNQQGGTSQTTGGTQLFFGKNLSERGDVVVVTIQYRLGPLGYLVHPGLEAENMNGVAGNYAVLDQILALQWVQNNITNFGGDPSKVMIFGESAGGLNVGNLLTTPLANGLFQRACIQSASPIINDYNDSKNKGIAYIDSFTTTGTSVQKIAYMRSLDADSLLFFESSPLAGGVVQMNWQPVVDNIVFSNYPTQVFQSGSFNKVPLIIGSNSEEVSLSVPQTVFPSMVTALINSTVPPAYQAQALVLYPPGSNSTQARESYVGILSDAQFTSTTRRTAQCVSLNQTEPVWRYFFTHKHTIPQLATVGSYHGMELFYVFNNWENATLGSGILFKPADDSVQNVMLDYWVNFANTGNPNGSGLVNWNQYQSSTDCYIEIKATPNGTQCGLRTAESNLWDNVAGFPGCTSTLSIKEVINSETLFIYPNPTNKLIHVDCQNGFQIFNSTGQLLKQSSTPTNQINISSLPKGLYFLKSGDMVERFIKIE
ncbi:MAG: carboxylesterase family protein [Vicingaceae bacterium]|nr:carboxylesterase family protein [Vicingaceae bacterium]